MPCKFAVFWRVEYALSCHSSARCAGNGLKPPKGGHLRFSSVGGAVILRKKVKNSPHLRHLKWGEELVLILSTSSARWLVLHFSTISVRMSLAALLHSGNRKEVSHMELLTKIFVSVVANVISHYIRKWLDRYGKGK